MKDIEDKKETKKHEKSESKKVEKVEQKTDSKKRSTSTGYMKK
jgi:hypothetical protein